MGIGVVNLVDVEVYWRELLSIYFFVCVWFGGYGFLILFVEIGREDYIVIFERMVGFIVL